ncbi:hypothetical protein D3C71_25020 [compost metagenome]
MDLTQYKQLWETVGLAAQNKLLELLRQLQPQLANAHMLKVSEVALETNTEDFFASLVLRDPGIDSLVLAISCTLVDLPEGAAIKLTAEGPALTSNGVQEHSELWGWRPRNFTTDVASTDGEELLADVVYAPWADLTQVVAGHIQRWAQMSPLQRELSRRFVRGYNPVTVAEMSSRLGELGYKLDRDMDAPHTARYMSGASAGEGFPAISTGVREADSGLTFANVNARRDAKFDELQHLRLEQSLFAVVRGSILDI